MRLEILFLTAVLTLGGCSSSASSTTARTTKSASPQPFIARGTVSIQAEATVPGRSAGLADCRALLDQRIRDAGQIVLYGSRGELLGAATVDPASLALDTNESASPVLAVCTVRWTLPNVPPEAAYRMCTGGVSAVVSPQQLMDGVRMVINYNPVAYVGMPPSGCTGGH
jgi:hypothetical protein